MKIEKVKSREYKDKTYYKYRIILPSELLKKSGLKEGDELIADVKKKGKIELGKRG